MVKWTHVAVILSTTGTITAAATKNEWYTEYRKPWKQSPLPSDLSTGAMSVGKISYNFPFIPLTTMALKKMRTKNTDLDAPDAEGSSIQASARLVIDPSQSLGDMSAADLEKLMNTDTVPAEPAEGTIRLAGSQLDYMGRVEVYHNHQWGSVCGFQWDRSDAEVVCRQLGFDTGRVIAVTRPEFGPANDIPVYYNYVDCNGSEERLTDCYAKKNFTPQGLVCNRWRRGATVICGCGTETPKHGNKPKCSVSTIHPFDSYTCTYTCHRGYTLEGVNMRHCLLEQKWDTELPRCVPNKPNEPRKLEPETRTVDINHKVCKRPPNAIECGYNITDEAECTVNGGCFNNGVKPNCYYPECVGTNPCQNGGQCITLGKPKMPYTCICPDGWVGSQCQYKDIVTTCGRSSYTEADHRPIYAYNDYFNQNRRKRAVNPDDNGFDLLAALGLRRKQPKIESHGLEGISNEHLEQILRAGMVDKQPQGNQINVNLISKDPKSRHAQMTRIVGGDEVTSRKQHPWVVMIKIGWRYVCAGVLIAPRWVITAAHCGFEKHIKNNTSPGDSWTIVAGEKSQFEVSEVLVRIEKAIMHDYTHFADDIPRNDLMLLKLDKELKQTDTINYACLPKNRFDTPRPGDMCTIAGWGVHNKNGDQPEFLNYAQIPIMSKKNCQSKHTTEKDYESISDDMICAGFDHGGTDACNGDSGGPLMCSRSDDTVFLPGIISWGYECAQADTPGVYTKNAHYLDWIHKTIHDNS